MNRYGCSTTHPPDTAMLLSKVATIVALPVAAADIVTAVPTTDTTVVLAGMLVPDTLCPAPTRTFAAAKVNVAVPLVVAVAVNSPTLDIEAAAVNVRPVGVPAVVVMAVPPKVDDSVKVVEPLVAVM